MLRQFQAAYDAGVEDEESLGEHVAMYLQSSALVVPAEDLTWVWELLVASRQSSSSSETTASDTSDPLLMDTPVRRLSSAVRAMLQPLPLSSVHANMQHFHGLPSVCNVLLSVCFSAHTAHKVLSVLLETLLPDYHVASMSGFRVDWKIVDLTLARLDPALSRHLAEHNVSIEVLCSQWFFSMFADAFPSVVTTQLYTWVLATSSKVPPSAPSNWLVATALALLLFVGDVLHGAADATTVMTLLHHFSHVVLATDEDIRRIFQSWIHAFHLHFHDALHACRVDISLEEEALPRRIFVGWRHPPTSPSTPSSVPPEHARQEQWQRVLLERGAVVGTTRTASTTSGTTVVGTEVEAAVDADIPRTSQAPHAAQWPALRHVLVAFACRHPHIGYCQGMNELAAVLLREVGDDVAVALEALAYLVDEVFPHYHSPSLLGLHVDCAVIETLVHQNDPHLVHHMQSLGLNMEILCTNWLMACFITTAPHSFHMSLLDMLFAAESADAASAVVVMTSVAIFLHLSSSLIHQHDTGGVLHVIKRFLASQSSSPPEFLSVVRTLLRQLPLHELRMMREVHGAAVHDKQAAFEAKKAAIKAMSTAGTRLSSPPPPPISSSSSSRFKRFLGGHALKKAPPLPSLFSMRRQDEGEKSRWGDEVYEDEDADREWDLLQNQLQHTNNLLEDDAIDAVECAHIKERIIHTWSAARHTPAHAQTRVDLLKAALFVSPQQSQPLLSRSKTASALVSRHTARARASLQALGVKWRSRSPSKPSDISIISDSGRKKTPLSPTALQLSEIADSYYGGDLTHDQRMRRKADLITKSLFPDDDRYPDNDES
ncbi:hypothetical protein H257_14341 [Aphanomyces astaci]|uniref:Rab-GAP TBC domain-containing protein n=1 Tax=Aphanomyces astaci TaxID=112090 RepID=W4FTI3_APHAT|nr:hypothetical protein H257_14341 [Aphanomyces astaci]ETV69968.1 hypothetical protein H257_14341 [Aphanomyces astaci]|eukprot:XP_009840411.1 hypothetical protein H257_14341 [Aphanomyces astaci]